MSCRDVFFCRTEIRSLFSTFVHRYYHQRFQTSELSWLCASIETTENKKFHMLTKTLPEDQKLRDDLRLKKQNEILKPLLEQKRKERADDTKTRNCLFCRKTFDGKPHDLFQHMYIDHNFNVGRADNLVFVDDFLAVLQEKLNNLNCLYCEKTFKTWEVLKEHMRKKQHKQLNPENTEYDKFYIVSYLFGESKANGERDVETEETTDQFEDWSEEHKFEFICLFCDHCEKKWDELFQHMKSRHYFDFGTARSGLGFYDQVKLVNFIRRQTHINVCYLCEDKHETRQALLKHVEDKHREGGCPPRTQWDQPGYFFPTYENDQLLQALEDDHDQANEDWVLPEDPVQPSVELLKELQLNWVS